MHRNYHGVQMRTIPGMGTVAYPGIPRVPTPIYPAASVRQDQYALGATTDVGPRVEDEPMFRGYNKLSSSYVVSVTLGGDRNNTSPGTVTLRPEPFLLKRITWATTGDTYPYVDQEPGYSLQGRSVRMKWGDEFTKLFGNTAALVCSAMGDSNGFLDNVRGIIFQGSQTLSIELLRLHWPSSTTPAATEWDFVFSGVSLLPPGVNQSGSAG
jgi:hypothetical protein